MHLMFFFYDREIWTVNLKQIAFGFVSVRQSVCNVCVDIFLRFPFFFPPPSCSSVPEQAGGERRSCFKNFIKAHEQLEAAWMMVWGSQAEREAGRAASPRQPPRAPPYQTLSHT